MLITKMLSTILYIEFASLSIRFIQLSENIINLLPTCSQMKLLAKMWAAYMSLFCPAASRRLLAAPAPRPQRRAGARLAASGSAIPALQVLFTFLKTL